MKFSALFCGEHGGSFRSFQRCEQLAFLVRRDGQAFRSKGEIIGFSSDGFQEMEQLLGIFRPGFFYDNVFRTIYGIFPLFLHGNKIFILLSCQYLLSLRLKH